MMKILPDTTPEMTPGRASLAGLLVQRDAALAEMEVLQQRSDRLARAKADVASIEGELNALNLAEAAAWSTWAELGDGSPTPVADTARRAEVMLKLTAAQAQARAADNATASISAVAAKQAEIVAGIQPHVAIAAALVLADEVSLLMPEMVQAIARMEAVRRRILAGRGAVMNAAHRAPQGMGKPAFDALARLDAEMEVAGSVGADDFAPSHEFDALLAALQTDAHAGLGDND
jgi:hypothetical protein